MQAFKTQTIQKWIDRRQQKKTNLSQSFLLKAGLFSALATTFQRQAARRKLCITFHKSPLPPTSCLVWLLNLIIQQSAVMVQLFAILHPSFSHCLQ